MEHETQMTLRILQEGKLVKRIQETLTWFDSSTRDSEVER